MVIECSRRLAHEGLNINSSGNFSIRTVSEEGEGFLITPSGMSYDCLKPKDICFVRLSDGCSFGFREPSSEWRLHSEIYLARPELRAIAHTHSPFAAVLSCRDESIPPLTYMTAVSRTESIPCAPYATFGSEALAEGCVKTLGESGRACLLSHHGAVACGANAKEAEGLAREIENLARMWAEIQKLGGCKLLDSAEMKKVLKKFENYGQRSRNNQ